MEPTERLRPRGRNRRGAWRGDAASLTRRTPGMVPRSRCASANLLALATASAPNQPAAPDRRHAAPAMPALMCDRGVEKRGMHLPACIRHRPGVPPTILSHHGETRGTTTRGASTGWRILYLVSCTPPPFETGVCDRLAARCGIRAASRDRGPCPPFPDAPPTAPRSRLRVRPADRLSLPPAKPVRAASSCLTRPRCGVEATPLDAVWHGSPHGRARTAQPRRLEERRARTGDIGCASYPPARCAARYRTSAGTVHVDRLTG